MRTPVLSAFYFGSVEHYRVLAQYPKVIIDTGEHYERQSYRTRTSIVGPNGVQDLIVPIVRRSGEKMPMHSVGLSYAENWRQQHVHAIRSAYGNTPWFIHYIDEIEAVVLKKYERLCDLDLATMRLGMKCIGLSTEVEVSKDHVDADLLSDVSSRSTIGSGEVAHGTTDSRAFDLRNILHPKKMLPPHILPTPRYPQVFADRHGFQARMSIIDLMMNSWPDARAHLLR